MGDRLGLAPDQWDEQTADVWKAGGLGTIDEQQVHHALAARLGLPDDQASELMVQLWQQYLGTPNTELIAYAHRLRGRYRTGILSNSFVGAREREQAAYGLTDLVDVLIYSHEAGMAKPDPRIYELTCQHIGVHPGEMLFVDDVETNVVAAREAGIRAIHYQANAQAITDIDRVLTVR